MCEVYAVDYYETPFEIVEDGYEAGVMNKDIEECPYVTPAAYSLWLKAYMYGVKDKGTHKNGTRETDGAHAA